MKSYMWGLEVGKLHSFFTITKLVGLDRSLQNTPTVQMPKNHRLTQNLYHNCDYPKPKYLIIRYLDPLG